MSLTGIDKPLISVVIPAYNSEKYIAETIRSVQAQDWESLEIIVMDDASTDRTFEIVSQLAQEDSRIKVYQQANGKPAQARNNAVRRASGDWIAFIDSDDHWLPGKLQFQYEKTVEENVDLSFTDGFICLNNDMNLRNYRFGVQNAIYEGEQGVQLFHAQNCIPTSTVLMRKSVFYEYGFMPEYPRFPMYSEDYLYWVCLLNSGCRFLGLNKPLVAYRVHSESAIGDEIRLMDPLLRVLLFLPGTRKEAWKRHTESTLLKYIHLLQDSNNLRSLDVHVYPISLALYGKWKAILLKLAWMLHPKAFLSVFWRLRLFK